MAFNHRKKSDAPCTSRFGARRKESTLHPIGRDNAAREKHPRRGVNIDWAPLNQTILKLRGIVSDSDVLEAQAFEGPNMAPGLSSRIEKTRK